ncbi:MAG: hypothetical protein K1W27_07015 [Lachnospiraceae bacterium]|jgi:hypothetical protein|nr:hypothetical protein C804_05819 [Lachnospiraceae bacterium A4]
MTTVIPDPNDKEYLRICDKLGFTLPEYKVETSGFEDDSKISPFSVLTTEELLYLLDNGFFNLYQQENA